jgi:hypothetical protein
VAFPATPVGTAERLRRAVGAYVLHRTDIGRSLTYNSVHAPASRPADLAERSMNLHITLAPILALLAGILILVRPKLLSFIVAIYLIIIGILGLTGGRF